MAGARRRRWTRAIALTLAALLFVALVGGCGGGSAKPTLAEQDHLVELSNQLAAIHEHYAATQRRLEQARRALAPARTVTTVKIAARPTPARKPTPPKTSPPKTSPPKKPAVATPAVTTPGGPTTTKPVKPANRSFVLSIDTLCSPLRIHATTGPQRRALRLLEQRRKQALYFLNLSCPEAV